MENQIPDTVSTGTNGNGPSAVSAPEFVDNPNYQAPATPSNPSTTDSGFVDNPNFGKPHYDPWSSDTGSSLLNGAQDVVTGIGKGVAQTGLSLYKLASKGLFGDEGMSPSFSKKADELTSPQGTAENIGSGLESIAEFMMGDLSLKGLSIAEKLKNVSSIMKFVEKSPALANALKLGINIGKAGTELGPEERALLQKYPILARLAGHGLDAIRQGVVQGVQTGVKTGDTGEAAKSGLTMAGTSAVLGVPFGVAGGLLSKGAEAADKATELASQAASGPTGTELNNQLESTVHNTLQPTIDTAQAVKDEAESRLANAAQSPATMAANAPEHEAITASAQKAAKNAYDALGKEFEKGRETLVKATDGQSLTYEESPLRQAAQDLAGEGKASEHPLDEAFSQTRPGSTKAKDMIYKLHDPYGEKELKEAASEASPAKADGTGGGKTPSAQAAQDELDAIAQKKAANPITLSMEDLLDRRKLLNERLRATGWATDEQRADRDIYHRLIDGVDDSVQQLTEQSGNTNAIETLGKMNSDYKAGITRFKNPDVKALLQGTTNDVAKKLMSGGTSIADINTVRDAIGKDAFNKLADSAVQRMAADSIDKTTGQFNFKNFFSNWTRISPQVRAAMFQESLKGGAVENAIMQAQKVNASGAIPGAEATIKDTTKAISDLLGNGDVKSLIDNPERVQALAQTVGPEAMGELGTSVLQNQLRESATNLHGKVGMVDTDKMLKFVSSLKDSPEIVDSLFRATPERAAAYDRLIKSVSDVNKVKNLVKFGIITPSLGAAGGAAIGHAALPAVLGALAAEPLAGFSKAKEFLDHIANHPATWASLKAADKAAKSSLASGASVVSKLAAAKTANTVRDYLQNAMSSTKGSLQ